MARVKNGRVTKQRRNKVLKEAKGYFGSKHRLYKTAQEQVFHSGAYAFRDRRQNKRNFRKLWITRINAACRENDINYSKFICGLSKANIEINRKMLSEIAINDPKEFSNLVKIAKDSLEGKKITNAKVTAKKVTNEEPKKEIKKEEKKDTSKAVKKEVKKEKSQEKLTDKTLVELKEMAKAKGIKGFSTMKKDELIKELK